jgi:hypothetical protein
MRKRIITVAFAAAILFSGAMLFQVENVDAQDATPADAYPELGKWIKVYNGDGVYWRDQCLAHSTDECVVGQIRRIPKVVAVPVGN